MDGWNTIVSFGFRPIFRGELLVLGRVVLKYYSNLRKEAELEFFLV